MSRAHGRPCLSPRRECYAEDSSERKAGTRFGEFLKRYKMQVMSSPESHLRLSKFDEVCMSHMQTD